MIEEIAAAIMKIEENQLSTPIEEVATSLIEDDRTMLQNEKLTTSNIFNLSTKVVDIYVVNYLCLPLSI
ncbi:MAG: hypothetical protein D0530_01260 [Methylococcales bacterium]|nr:MAG: hypothetical protein D0530_01260 [Methylococcales bacterium]